MSELAVILILPGVVSLMALAFVLAIGKASEAPAGNQVDRNG
ncbi:MAG TPA: hypothetical protein VF898_06555 [Chloroflexota bacterium]